MSATEGYDAAIDLGIPASVTNGRAGTIDNRPTEAWWRIAYAYRPPRFVRGRVKAIAIAEKTGAQFVQESGGDRRIVWEAMEGSEVRRLAAKRADDERRHLQ